MSPKTEWDVIDEEPATIGGIYTSYVMILAAIPAICMALGLIFFMPRPSAEVAGMAQAFGVPVLTTGSIIVGAVVQYVLGLVGVYVMAHDHRRAGAELRRHEGPAQGVQGRRLLSDRRLGRRHPLHHPDARPAGLHRRHLLRSTRSISACRG